MRISPGVTMVLPNPDTTAIDLPPGTPWLANNTIAEELLKFHLILGGKVREGVNIIHEAQPLPGKRVLHSAIRIPGFLVRVSSITGRR